MLHLPGNPSTPPSAGDRPSSGLVEDHRINGARNFGIAASDISHALLLAYGADGQLIADGGQKLRYG